ncbi:basic proline-rich protein-like [Rhinolophus ferrumequinum]|uniref:basic proline-rich protein-like n=1 Tax=Rhinolophus ferrumequinum TaxID=59479 RepID=UPI00140FD510|nr:basic proline-rich protein-like [Rhinolophus ferrumequinum]
MTEEVEVAAQPGMPSERHPGTKAEDKQVLCGDRELHRVVGPVRSYGPTKRCRPSDPAVNDTGQSGETQGGLRGRDDADTEEASNTAGQTAGAPFSPAPVRPPGGGCWGRGCALETYREGCESQRRPRRGSESTDAPHPSPAAEPPVSGEGKRGRWLLPPPRGQVPLMLQPFARALAQPPLPSSPPPPPAPPLARLSPPQSLSHPPPAPDSRRETPARSCRTAAPRPPTRKLSRRQPRGCQGCEPGSDFLVPVATGWSAKAFEDLEFPSFGRA